MHKVFLSIGSNLGLRKKNLSKAISLLNELEHTSVDIESSIYKTAPLYNHNQAYFFNKVIQISTKLNPYKLLEKIKSIESDMGRHLKNSHNLPRIIDIDILVFGNLNILSKQLIIPHPKILERRFVLEPWKEIAPKYILSSQGLSIEGLYNQYLHDILRNQKVELVIN